MPIYKFNIVIADGTMEYGECIFVSERTKWRAWHKVIHGPYLDEIIETANSVETVENMITIDADGSNLISVTLLSDVDLNIEGWGDLNITDAIEAHDEYWGGGFSRDSDTADFRLERHDRTIYGYYVGSQVLIVRIYDNVYQLSNDEQHMQMDFVSREFWKEEVVRLQREGWAYYE